MADIKDMDLSSFEHMPTLASLFFE